MLTIKNNLNSPQTIHTSKGVERLDPMASIDVEDIPNPYDQLYRQTPFLTITEGKKISVKEVAPEPNAAQTEAKDDELEDLRKQYTELTGKKPHHKKSAETLRAEIDQELGK